MYEPEFWNKEELMAEKIKLSDDLMNNVNAGYLYFNGDKWLVIDIRGAVVKAVDSYDEAYNICEKYNLRVRYIDKKEIEEQKAWWEQEKLEGSTDEAFEKYFYGRVLNGGML